MPEPKYVATSDRNAAVVAHPPHVSPSYWKRRLDRAAQQIAEGQYEKALVSLKSAHTAGGDDYACLLRVAALYRKLRRWTAALAAAQQALTLDRTRLDAYEMIMEVALEMGDPERAIAASYALIKIAPRYLPAYHGLGAAYVQQGRMDAAMRVANTLIRLAPESASHHYQKALLCQDQGEIGLAVQEFSQTLRLEPTGPQADAAREALETLDIYQLNQIVTLALEDQVFRAKLQREPTEAIVERGFVLSGLGEQLLSEFCAETLPDFPTTGRMVRYN